MISCTSECSRVVDCSQLQKEKTPLIESLLDDHCHLISSKPSQKPKKVIVLQILASSSQIKGKFIAKLG